MLLETFGLSRERLNPSKRPDGNPKKQVSVNCILTTAECGISFIKSKENTFIIKTFICLNEVR